jgi:hypothetical protein
MPTEDQAKADQQDSTPTADGNADALAASTASENQSATTADSAPAKEGVAAMDDYMMRLQEALAPAPDADAANDSTQAGENPPAIETDAPPAPQDADQDADPAATDAQEAQPPAAADDEPAPKKELRVRLSDLDARQQEAILLVKQKTKEGEPISLAEAEARVNAKYGVKADSETPSGDPAPAAPTPDALKSQIDQLNADRRKAAEDMDTLKIAELSEQIEDLQLQYIDAREAAKAADLTAEQEFQKQVTESRSKRDRVYPAAADPAHAIHAEADKIWSAMQEQQNPLVFDADAPFKVYQMAANNLGIAPSSTKSSPAPTPRPQAVQQSAVRRQTPQSPVASGGDRTSQTTTASYLPDGEPRSVFEYRDIVHKLKLD